MVPKCKHKLSKQNHNNKKPTYDIGMKGKLKLKFTSSIVPYQIKLHYTEENTVSSKDETFE